MQQLERSVPFTARKDGRHTASVLLYLSRPDPRELAALHAQARAQGISDPDERNVPLQHRRVEARYVFEPPRAGAAGRWVERQRWRNPSPDLD